MSVSSPAGSPADFAAALLRLEGAPDFRRLSRALTRTNFLRILGKTDRERWHAAFWTWVLDPSGSHELGDYAVRRLLSRMVDERGVLRGRVTSADVTLPTISDLLGYRVIEAAAAPGPLTDFSEVCSRAAMGTAGSRKTNPGDSSRFDILVVLRAAAADLDLRPIHLVLVGEVKVGAAYAAAQLERYSKWLHVNPKAAGLVKTGSNAPFLELSAKMESRSDREDALTIGAGVFIARDAPQKAPGPAALKHPWSVVTFETLIADILEPMLRQPGLDPDSVPLIRSYIDVAADTSTGILTMPPSEHRELVDRLFRDPGHRKTLLAIAAVLLEGDDAELADASETIQVKLGRTTAERATSLTPVELAQLGLAAVGDRLVHRAQSKEGSTQPVFKDDLVVEIKELARRGFEYVSGGGLASPDGPFSAQGLLNAVYLANNSKFSGAANNALRFTTGKSTGKSLAEAYEEARRQLSPSPDG